VFELKPITLDDGELRTGRLTQQGQSLSSKKQFDKFSKSFSGLIMRL